jgi:hypothetical protein
MARRSTKADSLLFFLAIMIGVPIYLFMTVKEAIGWEGIALGVAVILGGYFWYRYSKMKAQQAEREAQLAAYLKQQEARRNELMQKYGDEKLVTAIMDHTYWQGQTAEQLKDSLGNPRDIDEKVLKTKTKQIWKYHPTGTNRYGLRIIVENDLVIGWDEKM